MASRYLCPAIVKITNITSCGTPHPPLGFILGPVQYVWYEINVIIALSGCFSLFSFGFSLSFSFSFLSLYLLAGFAAAAAKLKAQL